MADAALLQDSVRSRRQVFRLSQKQRLGKSRRIRRKEACKDVHGAAAQLGREVLPGKGFSRQHHRLSHRVAQKKYSQAGIVGIVHFRGKGQGKGAVNLIPRRNRLSPVQIEPDFIGSSSQGHIAVCGLAHLGLDRIIGSLNDQVLGLFIQSLQGRQVHLTIGKEPKSSHSSPGHSHQHHPAPGWGQDSEENAQYQAEKGQNQILQRVYQEHTQAGNAPESQGKPHELPHGPLLSF